MSDSKETQNINIRDEDLLKRLESYSESSGRTIEDITEEAIREFLSRKGPDDQATDDDVFNPDPGA